MKEIDTGWIKTLHIKQSMSHFMLFSELDIVIRQYYNTTYSSIELGGKKDVWNEKGYL